MSKSFKDVITMCICFSPLITLPTWFMVGMTLLAVYGVKNHAPANVCSINHHMAFCICLFRKKFKYVRKRKPKVRIMVFSFQYSWFVHHTLFLYFLHEHNH